MDKLLDFPKGSDEAFKHYRFQCDCMSAKDAMDISVEEGLPETKNFILTLDFLDNDIWNRIKYAFQILRGHWTWREFVVRDEDARHLSDIFNPDKKYSELP